MGQILVFGHRNPDNDSICSAVAYAHLKNRTDVENVYVPARLGPVPPETAWVFERFGADLPDEIPHVRTRVRDVMTVEVVSVAPDENMLLAGRLMRQHGIRALPVVDEGGVVRGLVNVNILAERYIEETDVAGFAELPVTVGQLAQALGGSVLEGDPDMVLSGGVLIGAMEPQTMRSYIKPGDTLIVGDRVRTQPMAIEAGVACLIVTGGATPEDGVVELAASSGTAMVSSPHDTYGTARLVNLSHSVGEIMDANLLLVGPDMLLSEVAEDLIESPHREAVVVDDGGKLLGMITRTNLARGLRRRIILLDHNELAQSASGAEEATIVEIVDHHRVGDVQTAAPILFLNMPVGSTATIVAERYRELGVDVPISVAGLLLSAVLSDTVLLKSPTTTAIDREVAERLAALLKFEPLEFGMEMFKARSAYETFSAERVVGADLKEYRIGDASIAIGQVETVDAGEILAHRDEIVAAMRALREARRYDLVLLMVTDVVREGSNIVAEGRTRIAERGLGVSFANGSAWMDGVLSRKKQVAARLLEAVGA
ncbi:MAG: putative manganese-dependent inorganic diphosphatase [Coriobacteriia bacterium]|nr:putative manganese-dependent inorganic diphosphatase [Coriobacteriia bacterium]